MVYVIPDILLEAVRRYSEKEAVFCGDNVLRYQDVWSQSLRLANGLIDVGVRKGDRVCFFLEKRFEKVVSIFGISISGAVFVPIRRLLRPSQAVYIIKHCEASVLITTVSRAKSLFSHAERISSLKAIILLDGVDDEDQHPTLRIMSWQRMMEVYPASTPTTALAEKDIAAILYTSGSTGNPKGVVLSHLNIVAGAKKVSQYLNLGDKDRILAILSFGFDYGLNQLTTAFLQGAQIVLLDYLFPKDILKAVDRHRVTGLAAVAATWIQLLQIPWKGDGMGELRYITNSGGSIPPSFVLELKERLPHTDVYLMYGLTEAFRSTYLDPTLVGRYPDSIGRAIPGEEVFVVDQENRPVEIGQVGELVHRGVLVSQGYWADPVSTRKVLRPNPFQDPRIPVEDPVVYSGDYVRMDEQGLLYFVGRKDEMIKCAGNRISPTEVEEMLHEAGLIADAVCFGVPHEVYGQKVFVVVSPLPGRSVCEVTLMKYCHENMPPYMVPAGIEILESLPRNSNGKLDRSAVKSEVFCRLGLAKDS